MVMNVNEQKARDMEKTFEYYAPSAVCDDKTCEKCRQMNGKIFPFKDRKEGVNFPPFHEGCRCTFSIETPDSSKWIEDYVEQHGGNQKPKLSFWEKRKIKKLLKG